MAASVSAVLVLNALTRASTASLKFVKQETDIINKY